MSTLKTNRIENLTTTDGGISIDNSGRVGIGTSSPQRAFVVSDAGDEGFEFFPGSSDTGNTLNHYDRGSSAFIDITTNADQHIFGRADGEKMRIDSSGNVGIGTTSPQGNLEVSNSSGGATIRLSRPSSADFEFYASSDTFILTDKRQSSERLRIDGSGVLTVGSGANTATQRAAFLGGYTTFENSAGTGNPSITFNNDTNTGLLNPVGDQIAVVTAGSERARIDNSGRLLVGTTSANGGSSQTTATVGACTMHSTGIVEIAANGTLDLPSIGSSIVGHLYVHSVYTLNAAARTSKVFFVAGRSGNGFTATELNSNNGTTAGSSFTITNPSANILRFTDTSGAAVKVSMSFVGSLGF